MVESLHAQPLFLKKGKKIVQMESRMTNQDGKPVAMATATFYLL